jgi:hypothetical protein
LKAQGQEKGEDAFNKRLPVINQAKVGGFVVKIDSVVRFSRVWRAVLRMVTPLSSGLES